MDKYDIFEIDVYDGLPYTESTQVQLKKNKNKNFSLTIFLQYFNWGVVY